MAWETSDRKERLPKDWIRRREECFERYGRHCYTIEDGEQCGAEADEVDHVVPGDDHSPENLRPICRRHHKTKSSSEGWHAMNRKRKQTAARVEKQFGHTEGRKAPEKAFAHPWMRGG